MNGDEKNEDSDVKETKRKTGEAAAEVPVPAQEAEQAENVQAELPAEEAAVPEADCAKLQADLEKAKGEADDFKKKWYSVSAEYDNYRRRTALTRSQAYAEGRSAVVVKLFPIADSLERALAACADEGTKKGVQMVLKNFSKLLEEEKITPIAPVGEPFDATRCEAILAVDPQEGEESGIVKEVYAKGYEQDGKVLRFAQVLVTK